MSYPSSISFFFVFSHFFYLAFPPRDGYVNLLNPPDTTYRAAINRPKVPPYEPFGVSLEYILSNRFGKLLNANIFTLNIRLFSRIDVISLTY